MKIIDFHTHILPGADHGSDSIETSLAQIELSKSANVDIIVATPHFYPHKHNLDKFVERRARAYASLMKKSDAKIIQGAEVLLCDKLENMENLDVLCVEGTKTLLVELPFSEFRDSYKDTVEALIDSGYNVVLAHAERYPKESINKLLDVGAVIQLNVSSISRFFIKRHVREWLNLGYVVALGSDIHMLNKNFYKKFNKAKCKLKGKFEDIMAKTINYLPY